MKVLLENISIVLGFSIFAVAGCDRQSTTQQTIPASNLVASMSDEQILRTIGCDPAALIVHRDDGKDGYSMVYSNATTLVIVTRSLVSGSRVLRLRPEEQKQEWILNQ